MGAISFYKKKGTLRIYSVGQDSTGGSTGPKYLEVRFQNGNINFALGPAFPAQVLALDRNTFTTDAHYIDVDDTDVLAPLPLSFDFRATDKFMPNMLHSLSNPFGSTAWTVGNFTWTGYNESAITRKNGANTAITIPSFALSGIQLVRAELKLSKTSTDSGVQDSVFNFTGVHFPRDQVGGALGDDNLTFAVNGLIYGDVSLSTAFSSGAQTDT